VLSTDKRVKINQTDLSKITILDNTKDVPLKKPQSAYVLFGNEVSVLSTNKFWPSNLLNVFAVTSCDLGEVPRNSSDWSRQNDCEAVAEADKVVTAEIQRCRQKR